MTKRYKRIKKATVAMATTIIVGNAFAPTATIFANMESYIQENKIYYKTSEVEASIRVTMEEMKEYYAETDELPLKMEEALLQNESLEITTHSNLGFSANSGQSIGTIHSIFPDRGLAEAVALNLTWWGPNAPGGRNPIGIDDQITQAQLDSVRFLTVNDLNTSNLTGIERLSNLEELFASNANITDLSPLQSLARLRWLELDNNPLQTLAPLASLQALTTLSLTNNEIQDVSALQGLSNLSWINLSQNDIQDVTPLAHINSLTSLNLSGNRIQEVSVLQTLTNLNWMNLHHNQIQNVNGLQTLINLTFLNLSHNQIQEIMPLRNLTGLTFLNLSYNLIQDFSPLDVLTETTVDKGGNPGTSEQPIPPTPQPEPEQPAPVPPAPQPTQPTPDPEPTPQPRQGQTTARLNLRTGAGTNHRIIRTLPVGQTVTILSESNGWMHVRVGNEEGFVSSEWVRVTSGGGNSAPAPSQPTPAPETSQGQTIARLNLRAGAGTNHRIIRTLPLGQTVTILSESNGWMRIRVGNEEGFVSSEWVRVTNGGGNSAPSQPAPTPGASQGQTTARLNLRTGAGTSHRIIRTLPLGQNLTILNESNGWMHVRVGNEEGFVSSEFVR